MISDGRQVRSLVPCWSSAVAEPTIGLFKAELIPWHAPWRSVDQLESVVFEYVNWVNDQRLHSDLSRRSPAEAEQSFYDHQPDCVVNTVLSRNEGISNQGPLSRDDLLETASPTSAGGDHPLGADSSGEGHALGSS